MDITQEVKMNEIEISELNLIRDKIETLSKFNQVEILRIFSKRKEVTLNENKYGVHINLTDMNKEIIDELKTYISYVNTQEINLNELEKQKEEFKRKVVLLNYLNSIGKALRCVPIKFW